MIRQQESQADDAWMQRRRHAFHRYARLLTYQLQALESGDLDTFFDLQVEETEIRLGVEDEDEHNAPPAVPPGVIDPLREDILKHLATCGELHLRIQDGVQLLRDETLALLKTEAGESASTRSQLQRYVSADVLAAEPPEKVLRRVV